MNNYATAFGVIAVAVVGMFIAPRVWDLFAHTVELPAERYGDAAGEILSAPLPHSARVDSCVIRRSPAGKDFNEVLGCSLTVEPADFPRLLQGWGTLQHRSVAEIKPVLEVPPFDRMSEVSVVYYSSPPEEWRINEPLIYGNHSQNRVAAYIRRLVAVD